MLGLAIRKGKIKIVKYLVSKCGVAVDGELCYIYSSLSEKTLLVHEYTLGDFRPK